MEGDGDLMSNEEKNRKAKEQMKLAGETKQKRNNKKKTRKTERQRQIRLVGEITPPKKNKKIK